MTDTVERLRDDTQMLWDAVAEKNAEIERLRDEIGRLHSDLDGYAIRKVPKLEDEIERLRAALNSDSANRYWEGRWRDEKAENERLRHEVRRLEDALETRRRFHARQQRTQSEPEA